MLIIITKEAIGNFTDKYLKPKTITLEKTVNDCQKKMKSKWCSA